MAEGLNLAKLPPAVWVGVVGGGLALGFYFNKKNSTAQSSLVAEQGVGVGPGGKFVSVDPTPTDTTPEVEETNDTWSRKVRNWLIAQQYDPAVADNAVRKYIYGENLTLAEQAIINIAIAKFGVPPEALPPVVVPQPVPQPPGPVTNAVVTGRTSYSIKLQWTPVFGATKYQVKTKSSKGEWNAVSTILPIWDSGQYGTLSSGLEHTFTIWAENAQGLSTPVTVKGTPSAAGGGAPPPPPGPGPSAPPTARQHTVAVNEILTGISLRYYGNAAQWMQIYNANAGAIEGAARNHGRSNSRGGPAQQVGWYIYPGTVLVIP